MTNHQEQNSDNKAEPGVWKIILSVMSSFVGIQSNKNHDVDDAHIEKVGFTPYIIVGVGLTLAFVLLIYGVVQLILIEV